MVLQLIISMDELADSFLTNLEDYDDKLLRNCYRPDLKLCYFKSSEWLKEESSDPLSELTNTILRTLDGDDFKSIDIGLIMYANNNRIVELFLPLYQKLVEDSFKVLITYRIFFIYPQPLQIKTLTEFSKNYTSLQAAVTEPAYSLREIHLLLAPKEKKDGAEREWTKNQLETYLALQRIASYRSNLDALLARVKSPCSNSSHGRCVYNDGIWKEYYKNRTIQDLTERSPAANPDELNEIISNFSVSYLLFADGKIEFPPVSIREIEIKGDLEFVNSDSPLSESYQKYLEDEKSACRYIVEKNHSRIVKTKKMYQELLKDVQGRNATSLMGFEKALYAHRKMVEIVEERQVTLEPVTNKKVIDVLNNFIKNIIPMGCLKMPDPIKAEDCRRKVIETKIKEVQDAMWSKSGLTNEFTIIRNIFSKLLYNIEKEMDISAPEKIQDPNLELEIDNAISDLDNLFAEIKDDFYKKKELLKTHRREHGLFRRIFSPSYNRKKKIIQNEIENIQKKYLNWGENVNLFLETLNNFLYLYEPWKLFSKLPLEEQLEEERNNIKEAGNYLEIFDKALSDVRSDANDFIDSIPKSPVMDRNEMSFLCCPEFEKLYKEYKQADIFKYLEDITSADDEKQDFWELCFNKFIPKINSHAESLFNNETLPKLNLTVLMEKYFPELRVSRIRFLINSLIPELIPLVQKNLKSRYYQMLYSSNPGMELLLRNDEENILFENPDVSLNDTEFVYIENNDMNNLDLTINLVGFKVEEYLYWDAFVKKRKSNEN